MNGNGTERKFELPHLGQKGHLDSELQNVMFYSNFKLIYTIHPKESIQVPTILTLESNKNSKENTFREHMLATLSNKAGLLFHNPLTIYP